MGDDHEMVLQGIRTMLSHDLQEVEIAGVATTLDAAFAVARCEQPDVVLTDAGLGKDLGLDRCRRLKQADPSVHVVFLTVRCPRRRLLSGRLVAPGDAAHHFVEAGSVNRSSR